ncbi:hypothetical protein CC85DRAFT_306428 [Cutaneotrichosporon oleaginosum]|uniref:J domain-containing protein n=1 Tax=Cutaneotrichosporon oleaginosum TaxID=879819 RepID=A0A0J0XY15_9TREE|nr:uncharacterized protein CC85DRAFT_306428 [Cutaneotrichosporon oleaginosum]KLT45942.1 hypothetical protein CC85DRAFT_306428 [Cutaneotrichosporon oleaginosum]TXT06638.1 hypothetical protein COLE_05969 [Cutaneotrichosporon oleaginosum]
MRGVRLGAATATTTARPSVARLALRLPIASSPLSTTPRLRAPTRPCPSCGAAIPLPASPCPSCASLIPIPPGLSLHSLLSLSDPIPAPASAKEAVGARNPGEGRPFDIAAELAALPAHGYALDPRALRLEMLRRQATLHPDRNSGDVEMAAALSARVNKAYEVLANPQTRAEYILEQFGLDTKETDHVSDHDLLLEILEAREELEEATSDEVEELREANQKKVDNVARQITEALSKEPPELQRAKELAVELKYWVGLEHAARERL